MGHRALKKQIGNMLTQEDFDRCLTILTALPGRQVVNPLFSFFYSGDDQIRWRAITAMGVVVCHLAESAMESARVIMRRLMWNLNDESGGIGWGSPEAMGEIMAGHPGLAAEFAAITISYINPDGNFLEHEQLQRGSVWGVGRLAHAHPDLARPATAFLPAFCASTHACLRGTAIWASAPIMTPSLRRQIEALRNDAAPLKLFRQMEMETTTVGRLAAEALAASPDSHDGSQPLP